MEIRDQATKIEKTKDQFREAQEDLKNSYASNLKQMKQTFDNRVDKQSKNYAEHKTKLEEDNKINNEFYTEKTRSVLNRGQEELKNKLRENSNKFENERLSSKTEINEKLNNLTESYTKSFDENNRYQDQIKKSMGERYTSANKRYQSEFNDQISNMDSKFKSENIANREADRKDRMGLLQKNSNEMESLRLNSNEEKFQEVSRLRNDSENLRTTLGRENQMLKDRQEERVAELYKLKGKESVDGMKNFENLQDNIREKNLQAQEKQNSSHTKESKELETKFNEDVRNIQKIAAQKIRGGTSADSIHDELKQTKTSYENRLQSARDEIARNNKYNTEKEETIDNAYREKLKEVKTVGVENLAKNDNQNNENLKKVVNESREKNSQISDRYKNENGTLKKESEDRLSHANNESKNKIKEQRVEFGRVVNTLNDKSMETINALKDDFTKDKSTSIEKSKKEFNEDKVAMKNEFLRQNSIKETLYEQKLVEMEKQTNKVIENYENRISQIVKKADTEVTSIRTKEEIRKMKEEQANKLAFDTIEQENKNELNQMRDKYVGVIAKNQAVSEQKKSAIVDKYESQIARERNDHQKELTLRLSEAQSQFERLFKSSELEKETIRNQYEQRIENVKLASMTQDNSKKV